MENIILTKEGKKSVLEDKDYTEPFKWFVRILFVVIIGNGFRTFSANFSIDKFIDAPTIVQFTFFLFFSSGYFFVISDFLFYHIQIERYPYVKGRGILRFFEDICIFFVLYLILHLASIWPNPRTFWIFLLLLGIWHLLVMIWQFHVNLQYDRIRTQGIIHLLKSAIYFVIFGAYTYHQGNIPAPLTTGAKPEDAMSPIIFWIWLVVIVIGVSNGKRLWWIRKLT